MDQIIRIQTNSLASVILEDPQWIIIKSNLQRKKKENSSLLFYNEDMQWLNLCQHKISFRERHK